MQLIDISVGVSPDLPVWPGDPAIELTPLASMDEGDEANVTKLSAGVHVGTHVDAPRHFIAGGRGVDELPLDVLIGRALVVELPAADVISEEALDGAGIPEGIDRLLFKTRNSNLWATSPDVFRKDFVAVDEGGAAWLVDHGVRLVGVDYLSVAPWGKAVPTHQRLLGADVVIVEGLNLSAAEPGSYQLYCLPVKLLGCDGAPARALLGRDG